MDEILFKEDDAPLSAHVHKVWRGVANEANT